MRECVVAEALKKIAFKKKKGGLPPINFTIANSMLLAYEI